MANTVASRKAKGRRLQQYIAERISKILNIDWGKDELIRSREMGQSGNRKTFWLNCREIQKNMGASEHYSC